MRVIKRLRYINHYRDQHGHDRYYFRRDRRIPQIPLPGKPGSPEFQQAYAAALADTPTREPPEGRDGLGTIGAAIAGYYGHTLFATLSDSSRQMRRRELERIRQEHGGKPIAQLERKHIEAMIGKRKPQAALNLLKTLRGLMRYAVKTGLRAEDPTLGIIRREYRSQGGHIHTWDEAEIAQFEAFYPLGSKPRLALALMLNLGQRKSDIVRLGPQHVRGATIYIRQQKTKMAKLDEVLEIPVVPDLAAALAAMPTNHLTFLVTEYGKPHTAEGFGNTFRDWCRAAGLPRHCTSHGLRKACCRRLAEAGATAPQIMAISGHKSLSEAQKYIEQASKPKLAQAAMRRLSDSR